MKNMLMTLKSKGFFDIFNATVINSVVSFAYGIFIVRIMSKTEYGIFSYAQNILTFGFLFCSLGLNIGVMQYCSEERDIEQKRGFSKIALFGGFIASIITIIGLLIYSRLDRSGIEGVGICLLSMSFLCILYHIKEWITSNLRWQYKNREYGIVMNIHSVMNAGCAIVGAIIGGIYGVIIGIYIAYLIAICVGLRYLKQDISPICQEKLPNHYICKGFVSFSVVMCVVNAMISVLFTIDVFVIGNVLNNAEQVAMYKTASLIPFALNMIPNSVMTFMYPHMSKNKENKQWLKKTLKKLYLANGALNIFIGICLILVSNILIKILFGEAYADTVIIFRILIISYMISSTLRTPSANILGMLKLTKTAFIISAVTVVISVTLSYTLVNSIGIIGAAIGSCITFSIVGIVSFIIIIGYVYKK